MQVMIVEEDATLRTRITGALAPEGVNVLSFGRLGPAKEAARRANVDILVLGESIEGRVASDVALLAEWRNPRLGSILLSDRDAEAAEELFDLIPSLQAVLARDTGPRSLARVAIATARSQEGIVVLQEDQWTTADLAAELDAPVVEVPPARAAAPEEPPFMEEAPAVALDGPVPVLELVAPAQPFLPVEEVLPVVAEEEPALEATPSLRDALAPLRERLMQAQERLAALEAPAFAQELPTPRHEAAEAAPGLIYALPSFLRDLEEEPGDEARMGAPHPAMLPVQAAAPRRRLHLA